MLLSTAVVAILAVRVIAAPFSELASNASPAYRKYFFPLNLNMYSFSLFINIIWIFSYS